MADTIITSVVNTPSNEIVTATELISTTPNSGASLIGIYDEGGYYAHTTVEGALQDVEGDIYYLADNMADIHNMAIDTDDELTAHIEDTSTHGTVSDIVGVSDHQTISNKKYGGEVDYSEFDEDGTYVAKGAATVYRDELNDLIKSASQNFSSHLVYDYTEGTLDFKTTCNLNDWALMNVQINHDWKEGSSVEPHIHRFQNQNKVPNRLIQYRRQIQGQAKTTAWTSLARQETAYVYTSGTINQITGFGEVAAGGDGISNILQIRILRDRNNDSALFSSADTYSGDAEAVSFDVHIECDTIGSREKYVK